MTRLRLATRASELALAQSRLVAARIEALLRVRVELLPTTTSGDRLKEVSLAKVGGKGLFVKEIEQALLAGQADLAVHSAKDLPAQEAEGLVLAAFPERADPRDALVVRRPGATLASLPRGARVGTGSLRRTAQLRAQRPDLEVVPLRGNVGTRLEKLERESLDAVVLACAGLERLGLASRIHERLDPTLLLPAVAQGALALQTRAGGTLCDELRVLGHERTELQVRAERAFLRGLGGDCSTPLAALAEPSGDTGLRLRALLASEDGSRCLRFEGAAEVGQAQALGAEAARSILAQGGAELLPKAPA